MSEPLDQSATTLAFFTRDNGGLKGVATRRHRDMLSCRPHGGLAKPEFLIRLADRWFRTGHLRLQPLQITHGVLYPDGIVFCRSLHLEICLPPEIHLHLPLIVREDSRSDAPRRLSRTGFNGCIPTGVC